MIEKGGELQADIVASVKRLSVSNQFADEETKSSYGYLSGYKPKKIAEQIDRLREFFPGIVSADEKIALQTLPAGSEGWFAIPRWEKISPTYGEAVQKVFDLLGETRNDKFINYREGQLGPQYLRQSIKTAKAFQKISEEQKDYEILIIPAQFGIKHRGRSIRRAREVMNAIQFGLNAIQFGLGAYAIGIMLLTHPERLKHYNDLWIDCAGDEFAPDGDGDFSKAPVFGFGVGQVQFGASDVGSVGDNYGSASAFLPRL